MPQQISSCLFLHLHSSAIQYNRLFSAAYRSSSRCPAPVSFYAAASPFQTRAPVLLTDVHSCRTSADRHRRFPEWTGARFHPSNHNGQTGAGWLPHRQSSAVHQDKPRAPAGSTHLPPCPAADLSARRANRHRCCAVFWLRCNDSPWSRYCRWPR